MRVGMLTSGGDCQSLNATMRGVAKALYKMYEDVEIVGFEDGYKGLMYADYKIMKPSDFSGILTKGGTILGTSRQPFKLMRTPDENGLDKVEAMKHTYRKLKLECLVVLGGNGSQKTANLLRQEGLNIVSLPKTIDNDLVETDHCPGFGSAAKYLAATFAELERDCHVYEKKAVTIVEVMGRNAGWLTAASALSRVNGGEGPSLIYLCEPVFDTEQFLKDVQEKLEQKDSVLVAISEGIHDSEGRYVSEQVQSDAQDQFGHSYIAGSAKVLEELVRDRIGCKVRSIELNLMQRCAAHLASATDLEESRMLGMKACQCALEKQGGQMASIRRISADPYRVEYTSVPVSEVANKEKKVPLSWITEDGHDVTEEMMAYLRPLILGEPAMQYENGIPVHIELY